MNCANHQQTPAVAYCRTCGKPLCSSCTRQVMGVIYCENCLAERVSGTAPPPAQFQPAPGYQARAASAGPNPALAGLLGAIPFGVGAIYNGQYIKGLVHLGVFVGLIVAISSNLPDYWYVILGISIGFFVVYQIIDAVHTAKAIQAGRPAPDPFGLTTMFSPSGEVPRDTRDFSQNIPTGAVVLIGLGILFLLHNLGLWFLRPRVVWPLILIGLGVWLFARRAAMPGGWAASGGRGLMGPAVLVTLGSQFLLNNFDIVSFGRTLPVLLIVIGVVLAIQRSSKFDGASGGHPPAGPPPGQTTEGTATTMPPSEVKNG